MNGFVLVAVLAIQTPESQLQVARLEGRLGALEAMLQERMAAFENGLGALREGLGELSPLTVPFLASPPPSSNLVGVARVPVFAPELAVDSPAHHDIVFLKLRRVEHDGTPVVAETELTETGGPVRLPLDRNAALFVVDWSTSEGHSYQLVLRDGLTGRVAATVQIGPYEDAGSFIFVGYGVGLEAAAKRR